MSVKITISLDEQSERSIRALARKRNKTISGLIREFITTASKEENIPVAERGLGSALRTHNSILKATEKDYKALLGEIREEKFNTSK